MVSMLGRVWGTGKGPVGRGMSRGLPATTFLQELVMIEPWGNRPLD